ncbi:MAG: gliding motility protein GldN [Prevotellaceae bacterium]|jgi:gliding motility associated protien GldN|nr:gliding motility protein GldN [Prevotellaceae bacterium]
MKRILILNMLFALLFSYSSFAQEENSEAEEEEQLQPMLPKTDIFDRVIVKEKKPVEYAEIREEDVLWSRFIWRIIDCREKLNFHLYYPVDPIQNRKSLAQSLMEGISKGKIQAYDDENFTSKISVEKVMERLGAVEREIEVEDMDNPGQMIKTKEIGQANWKLVREYKIKEKWFFDKRYSRMDVRIIAVCPIKVFKKGASGNNVEAGANDTEILREELCWIYFPEARRVLANTTCYTGKNPQANISFDDIFHKRYFSSRITQATNVNDIEIREYTHGGLEALLESERIKNEMLQLESDVWSY